MNKQYQKRWSRGFWLVTAIFAVAVTDLVAAADPGDVKRVLLVYSDERLLPAGIIVDRAFREALEKYEGPVEILTEYLDRARFSGKTFDEQQRTFLREKYANRPPDVIMAGGTAALNFLLEFRDSLFPNVPIVHCAVADRLLAQVNPDEAVVGIPFKEHFISTLELALQLQPGTRQVAVVGGTSVRDRNFIDAFRESASDFEPKVTFLWLTDFSIQELSEAVSELPDDTLVLYLGIFEDAAGRTFVPQRALSIFAPSSSVPIYGAFATYLGHGIVGGEMVSFEEIGSQAGRITRRILEGMTPQEAEALEQYQPRPMFDWPEVRRWGLEHRDFPADSLFLNRAPGFWELHGRVILIIGSICLLEAGLIGLLIWQYRRQKRADAVIRENETRMNLAMESANFGIWIRDLATDHLWATSTWRKLFGFEPDEPLTFEKFLNRLPAEVREDTLETMNEAALQGGGFRWEFSLDLADDQSRWIESRGHCLCDDQGRPLRCMGISRDITAQKLAEESARDLGGRLIHAQEDAKTRLAHELHDDLSQRVSLLAVELDICGQQSPGSEAEITAQMETFSSRAKAIASDLHRLAHHLHPAKLDQLGLEPALESFCRELAQAHPLEVDFRALEMPQFIPDDVALCLYRIGQESLQNVVKHSGATRAEVRLRGKEGGIQLVVKDNGSGFDSTNRNGSGSLGMVGMEERARFVGGHCRIRRQPEGGTRVEAWVPIPGNNSGKRGAGAKQPGGEVFAS